jgi:hypothetical protein
MKFIMVIDAIIKITNILYGAFITYIWLINSTQNIQSFGFEYLFSIYLLFPTTFIIWCVLFFLSDYFKIQYKNKFYYIITLPYIVIPLFFIIPIAVFFYKHQFSNSVKNKVNNKFT